MQESCDLGLTLAGPRFEAFLSTNVLFVASWMILNIWKREEISAEFE